ncbi:DUF2723 domain-containing protein [Leptobacterium flavescens]|uniref:DUF2723 domain-containing protein n=1 Tax=Leptobacterium flavescens TaxID=472055 RepID=A0A6P0UJW0_9FLAO|nr:DUF2723 domain-containing protein [Leptobacterium flavescens]NER12690.1 DUF2723 domain-containing protein [Leptobacterium flavescens]
MLADQFKKWNTITGWVAFFIALLTYSLTVEPTASFWDAGEYISTSAKLQVGHPPGAPFFQMLGAFFAMFAPEAELVARMVNYMSVFSSAFTVLFVFWTITNLVRKLIGGSEEFTNNNAIAVLGSGMVGALALTFSDSFWFNAVETEVYAMSSLIMSLQLWLGLRWIDEIDTPRGNRWLVLIAFVIGLTFGIQFMGFLAIPSIGLLYYFKKYKTVTVKNFLLANIAVVALLMFVYKFSLTYVLKIFSWGELFFVNSVGLPFNSGTIIILLLFIGLFYYGLRYTRKKNLNMANTVVLCLLFMFIGFSSWLMLPIRANANVVINENDPADARALLAYYNREQYPGVDSPVYGSMYSEMFAGQDEDDPYKDDKPKYERDEKTGKYFIVNKYKDALPQFDKKHTGLMPRMWSSEHAENYMAFVKPLDFRIKSDYLQNNDLRAAVNEFKADFDSGKRDTEDYVSFLRQFGEYIEVQPPSLMDNLKFLFEYQFGYMYWRYFMWNFVGKQDDIQGKYDNHGNWLSGIGFIDSMRLGPQKNLPSDVKNNKGRNTYYFLPLILGLIGLIFQFKKDRKQFWVLLVFFLFTGLAIQFYTNVRPFEPRERDYSLVGSFYVFTLWIGIGVYALFDEFKKLLKPKILAPAVSAICLLAVPTVMAYQNWDDHDRSNKYTAQSLAKSYLDSVQEDADAIIFSIGDNDTFALWYAQEIEGYRTDVRTINTSLFATDWYIDQMKRQAYSSSPIPSQLTHDKYAWGIRDAIKFEPLVESTWNIKDFMNWVGSDDPKTKYAHIVRQFGGDPNSLPEGDQEMVYFPTNKVRIPVNKENVLKSGLVKEKDSALIVDYIDVELPRSYITKNRLLMLDIIANNDWKRPIYFTGGSFDKAEYIWMKDYLQLDGLVYKLVPIKTPIERGNPFEMGRIDADLMYDVVMKWKWGNSGDPNIYHDPETRKNSISYRSNMARLVEELIKEGKNKKAEDILDLAMEKMPVDNFGYYVFLEPYVEGYYKVGQKEKAREIYKDVAEKYQESLNYYSQLDLDKQYDHVSDIITDVERYRGLLDIVIANDDETFGRDQVEKFNTYLKQFSHFYDE